MTTLAQLLSHDQLQPPLPAAERTALATGLESLLEANVYSRSLTVGFGGIFFLGRVGRDRLLGLLAHVDSGLLARFIGDVRTVSLDGESFAMKTCSLNRANAMALRALLPFTQPQLIGGRLSVGCGDRLGLATPGHARAVRAIWRQGTHIMPIYAQQSIREMARTGHSPEEVLDDASWGVLQEGWRDGFGSDADHLKSDEDIDRCVDAGFTLYTIDPGDHVNNDAQVAPITALREMVEGLPWDDLEGASPSLRNTYLGRDFDLENGVIISFTETTLLRAAAKYGRAIAHTVRMNRHLATRMAGRPFELEVSVDETETPTTPAEHLFVASELRRLGVDWVSLAPRYVGRFEKGVDYIGDLELFEQELVAHAAIARAYGPYKLSIHSGSDKFSIYPIFARHAGELVHLKTAGTSYLEALRAIARIDPSLFREILAFSLGRYDVDKATYHVSADTSRVPAPELMSDDDLPEVLNAFDDRQVLHVTFGSVLNAKDVSGGNRFRERLLAALNENEDAHYRALEMHFGRHLAPFV